MNLINIKDLEPYEWEIVVLQKKDLSEINIVREWEKYYNFLWLEGNRRKKSEISWKELIEVLEWKWKNI